MECYCDLGLLECRAVGRYENLGVPVLFGGHNMPPVVEIGLTDLPKSGDIHMPYPRAQSDYPSLARIFGDLGRNEKLSEVEPPLPKG